MVFTEPDYETRQVLYEESEKITNATGWYPLVTGKRVRLHRSADPTWLTHGKQLSERVIQETFGSVVILPHTPKTRCHAK